MFATLDRSIAIKTLFTKRVPAADTGAALGLLDVLNSACGVAAPVLGGVMLGAFGSASLASAGATIYAALGAALLVVLHGPGVAGKRVPSEKKKEQ